MFKRSFLLVLLIVSAVFASAFATQMVITGGLPSAYDNGLTIEQAFKTSKVPILIEFYSDTCGSCKKLAPVIHELQETRYKDRLTMVMMDVDDPASRDIAQLFGVDALPALYVFDHHHMKKHQIKTEELTTRATIMSAIDNALIKTSQPAPVPHMGMRPPVMGASN